MLLEFNEGVSLWVTVEPKFKPLETPSHWRGFFVAVISDLFSAYFPDARPTKNIFLFPRRRLALAYFPDAGPD